MCTKKLQIIGTLNADTLDGKHAVDFASATDLNTLNTKVGDSAVSEQISSASEQIYNAISSGAVMYINLNTETMTADKTFEEIKAGRDAGRVMILQTRGKWQNYSNGPWYRLSGGDPGAVVFKPIFTSGSNSYKSLYVSSNGWVFSSDVETLPAEALPVATTTANGAMTSDMVTKLNGIAENANNYSLPIAGQNKLGGVKTTLASDADPVGSRPCYIDGNGIIYSINTDTTYSAGTGISLSGTTFSNSGVRSIGTGTTNGTISVNTNGTAANVAVKGLGSAAYTASTAYATSDHNHDGRYFRCYGLNEINIDNTNGCWSVDISDSSHGSVPTPWVNVTQFSGGHFLVQMAIKCDNDGNSNRDQGGVWFRNKYMSATWSKWRQV